MSERFHMLILTTLLLFLLGCEKDRRTTINAAPIVESSYRGLLFVAGDAEYQAASLYFYDFSSGNLNELSPFESTNPLLVGSGSRYYLFNRTADQRNWRRLTFTASNGGWEVGAQKALDADAYDPYQVMILDDEKAVFANFNSNSLVLFDLDSGEATPLDMLEDFGGEPFRPVALWRHSIDGEDRIYVAHQGIGTDYVSVTDNQQVLAFTYQHQKLTPRLLQASKPGLPLSMTAPNGFFAFGSNEPLIAGSCSLYISDECTAGIDALIVEEQEIVTVYSWDNHELKMNGGIIATESYGKLIAQMAKPTGSDQRAVLALVDVGNHSTEVIYEYANDDRGHWPLWYDESYQRLFVSARSSELTGKLLVFDREMNQLLDVELPGVIYTGVLVEP